MNPLDAREADETYEYPARPYTLPMRPVQTFRVLSESGDVPTAQTTEIDSPNPLLAKLYDRDEMTREAWSDKYLTAEDARVLRQDGI